MTITLDHTHITSGPCGCDQGANHLCDRHVIDQLLQRLGSSAVRFEQIAAIARNGMSVSSNRTHTTAYVSIFDLAKTPV